MKKFLNLNLLLFIVFSILASLFFIGIESPLIVLGDRWELICVIPVLFVVSVFYKSNYKLIQYENKVT